MLAPSRFLAGLAAVLDEAAAGAAEHGLFVSIAVAAGGVVAGGGLLGHGESGERERVWEFWPK